MGVNLRGFTGVMNTFRMLRTGFGQDSRWIVGVGAEYGAYLEFGTSKMRSYPYLFPAARHVMRTQFHRLVEQAKRTLNVIPNLVKLIANAIEAEAKRRASGRPGPRVRTGNLRDSIEAAPASGFTGGNFGGGFG